MMLPRHGSRYLVEYKGNTSRGKMNGSIIHFTKTVRKLGHVINENLSRYDHIKAASKKKNSLRYTFLVRHKNFLPESTKVRVVNSLIVPHFDYCNVIYGDLNSILSNGFQKLHNICIRFILNKKKGEHITPYLSKLPWLRLKLPREMHALLLLLKLSGNISYRNCTPKFLLFVRAIASLLGPHNSLTLTIPYHKSDFYSRRFSVQYVWL
ncbi:hypothetical protein PR048_006785 [Dryococelus australis]|uniref:Maturase K n=1 Tax=Dryococelus australis TaxID=614101 RepID=A0ABQ9ID81_9NEOP|nr:hypothetical protein PR048_006785 [Dryococelus australis]